MGYVRKLTTRQIGTAVKLYRLGWSCRQIGELFGVTWQAIYYHLRRRSSDYTLADIRASKSKGNESRDRYGITVTLRAQDNGELRTAHLPGRRLDALRGVVAWIDAQERDWRLRSYSTPQTILGDMRGGRIDVSDRRAPASATMSRTGRVSMPTQLPEIDVLARIGRPDLLDPELQR